MKVLIRSGQPSTPSPTSLAAPAPALERARRRGTSSHPRSLVERGERFLVELQPRHRFSGLGSAQARRPKAYDADRSSSMIAVSCVHRGSLGSRAPRNGALAIAWSSPLELSDYRRGNGRSCPHACATHPLFAHSIHSVGVGPGSREYSVAAIAMMRMPGRVHESKSLAGATWGHCQFLDRATRYYADEQS